MQQKVNRNGRYKKRKTPFFTVLFALIICVGISLALAYIWQQTDKKPKMTESSDESSSAIYSTPQQSQSSAGQTSTSEQSASALPAVYDYSAPVPLSARVDSDYFNDALFVGDSITAGIQSYSLMQNATVIAFTGINPDTILTREVIRNEAGELETIPAAMSHHPEVKKIYVMLGANGIAWIGKDSFVKNYLAFLDEARLQHPGADIYVQSILPVTDAKQKAEPDITNAKITEYNEALKQMAAENEYYYLDVASVFADETGCLPDEASPTDGMHFGPKYYEVWFEYLKNHVAQ